MRNFAKKAISLLCVLSMLFSMVITSSAQQVETTISVENQTIEQCSGTEEVEVPIKIANNTRILGMKLSVTFDDELTLVNAVKGTALSSLTFSKSKEFTDVPFNLVWDGEASADTNNGVIATLTFEVPKGTYDEIFNSNLEKYGGNGKSNGSVKTSYEYGKHLLKIDIPAYSALFFKKKPNKVVVK